MANENLLKMAEQKFQSAAEKIAKDLVATCYKEPQTNADRIRAMSDEELASLLLDGCRGSKCDDQPQNEYGSVNCFQCRMEWLKQPAE